MQIMTTMEDISLGTTVTQTQQPMEETREIAVTIRDAVKGYGSNPVLKGLNMTVPKGKM